jgi:hypothetical protein
MSVIDIFAKAVETFKEREEKYGDTRYPVTKILRILYPNGISLSTEQDFLEFHIFQLVIGKIVRFAYSGDQDSIHDAGVYSFILEDIVEDKKRG